MNLGRTALQTKDHQSAIILSRYKSVIGLQAAKVQEQTPAKHSIFERLHCGLKRGTKIVGPKSSKVRESRSLRTFGKLEAAAKLIERVQLETERFNDYYSLEGKKQVNTSERKAKTKPFHHVPVASYQPSITEYGSPLHLSARSGTRKQELSSKLQRKVLDSPEVQSASPKDPKVGVILRNNAERLVTQVSPYSPKAEVSSDTPVLIK